MILHVVPKVVMLGCFNGEIPLATDGTTDGSEYDI